jgi:hypothetical protein
LEKIYLFPTSTNEHHNLSPINLSGNWKLDSVDGSKDAPSLGKTFAYQDSGGTTIPLIENGDVILNVTERSSLKLSASGDINGTVFSMLSDGNKMHVTMKIPDIPAVGLNYIKV